MLLASTGKLFFIALVAVLNFGLGFGITVWWRRQKQCAPSLSNRDGETGEARAAAAQE